MNKPVFPEEKGRRYDNYAAVFNIRNLYTAIGQREVYSLCAAESSGESGLAAAARQDVAGALPRQVAQGLLDMIGFGVVGLLFLAPDLH